MSEQSYELGEMQGILFHNDKKTSEKSPGYTGRVVINGKTLRVAAWVRQARTGSNWISLQLSEFEAKGEVRAEAGHAPVSRTETTTEDDLPF